MVGLAEAMVDLARWGDQLGPAVAAVAQPFAQTIVGRVRSEVPVLTGVLAGSVQLVDEPMGAAVGYGEASDEYAGWIEFGGTRGRPAVPEGRYLYPIALAAEDEFTAFASNVAEDTARRYPWS